MPPYASSQQGSAVPSERLHSTPLSVLSCTGHTRDPSCAVPALKTSGCPFAITFNCPAGHRALDFNQVFGCAINCSNDMCDGVADEYRAGQGSRLSSTCICNFPCLMSVPLMRLSRSVVSVIVPNRKSLILRMIAMHQCWLTASLRRRESAVVPWWTLPVRKLGSRCVRSFAESGRS